MVLWVMRQILRYIFVLILMFVLTPVGFAAQQLYTEPFTGEGDVNLVGWVGVYNTGSSGGVTGGFAWVWHSGNCGNFIYTREYTVNPTSYQNIIFGYDLRRNSYYSTTPNTSIAIEVGGNWYVSKTVFTETNTTFQSKSIAYDPSKNNWDTLNITTLARGTTASSDLSGNITGFGLYSNSQNVGSDCTAEYDNFIITSQNNLSASNPFPADSAANINRIPNLTWTPGTSAGSHNVYFGTDYAEVNNANNPNLPPGKGSQMIDANSFGPGILALGKTYYWRIDEVNDSNVWKGNVWKFTVTSRSAVDFDNNGTVNFLDYALWAKSWLTETGDTDFNSLCNLNGDGIIDITDLLLFTEDWLWIAPGYASPETNRIDTSFNVGWKFYKGTVSGDNAKDSNYNDSSWLAVNLPHNPPKSGQSGIDSLRPTYPNYSYEGVSWYRKHFTLDNSYQGRKLFVEFEAINTRADVWVNGTFLTTHLGGYLPFTIDVTNYVTFGGADNVIAVKADNTDDPNTPIGNSTWFNWGAYTEMFGCILQTNSTLLTRLMQISSLVEAYLSPIHP